MHPLARYLIARGLTQSEFAELTGISPSVLSRGISGARPRFSVPAALAIERATKGTVTLGDCVRPVARGVTRRSTAAKSAKRSR